MEIYDNTLREGRQNVDINLSLTQKIIIIEKLISVGIKNIEIGFISVSNSEKEDIRLILKRFKNENANLYVFGRLMRDDINKCIEVGAKNVTLFIPSSNQLLQTKIHKNEKEALQIIHDEITYATKCGLNVRFSCEDATNTSIDRLTKFYSTAQKAGAFRMSFPDTMGTADFYKIYDMIYNIKRKINCSISIHCHNDLGLATANAIAALRAGVDEIQGTVLGVGERVGNTDLLEILINIYHHGYSNCSINFKELKDLYLYFAKITNTSIPHNKPIIGRNQFLHESGLHVAAMVNGNKNYEGFSSDIIDANHQVIYGKMSGIANIDYLCNKYNLNLDKENRRKALEQIKLLAEKENKSFNEVEILKYIQNHVFGDKEC